MCIGKLVKVLSPQIAKTIGLQTAYPQRVTFADRPVFCSFGSQAGFRPAPLSTWIKGRQFFQQSIHDNSTKRWNKVNSAGP